MGSATPPPRSWAPEIRRVLAVRLDALGDVLMTTPAIRAVRDSGPGRAVTMLTSPSGAAAARLVPEIDHVIEYAAPWMKATPPRPDPSEDLQMIDRLRADRYDAAVIFTVYSQNSLPAATLCYLAGIPRRLAHSREPAYQLLTDRLPEPEPERFVRHEVRRQLDLVAAVGCRTEDHSLSLRVGLEARRRAAARLRELGLDLPRPWAVLHPGGSAPSRRYPEASFASAATDLARRHGWSIVLVGDDRDRGIVERVRASMGAESMSVCGELGLEELAALLALAPVVIANNSGPAHVAAAVGTPVVDLYALTNPQHAPWGVPSRVLFRDVPCAFCYASTCPEGHHACLQGVPPREVVAAALELSRTRGRPSASNEPAAVPA